MVLIATSIGSFMTAFDGSAVNLALPTIGLALKTSLSYIIWIPTVYLVAIAALETTMGRIGDLRGRRKLFLISFTVFSISSLGSGLSYNISTLILTRILQGVGAAGIDAAGMSLLAQSYPALRRGRAFGIVTMCVYLGAFSGPLIGGILLEAFGWRSIFYVNVPVGIIAILLIIISVKKDTIIQESYRHLDYLGAFTFGSFLVTLLVILNSSDLALSNVQSYALDAYCVGALAAFIYIEKKVAAPLIDLDLITHNRLFASGMSTALMNYMTAVGVTLLLSIYLQSVLGLSPIDAGLVLAAQMGVMVIASPIAGTLSDRVSAQILSSAGMASKAVGLFLLSFLTTHSPLESVWVPLIFVGLGHGFFSSPNINSVMSSLSSKQYGIGSGALGTVRTSGQAIGTALLGSVVAIQIGASTATLYASSSVFSEPIAQSFVVGMRYALLLASALSVVGVFTSLSRGKPRKYETVKK